MASQRTELQEGQTLTRGAMVDRISGDALSAEKVVIELYPTGAMGKGKLKRKVKEEMSRRGYVYHFTRDQVGKNGKMWFRHEDDWNMEPGAGDS